MQLCRRRRLRIVLDHGYHRVDPDIILRTVDDDPPVLHTEAMRLRPALSTDGRGRVGVRLVEANLA